MTGSDNPGDNIPQSVNDKSVQYVKEMITGAIGLLIVIFMIIILIGTFSLVGDPDKLANAKDLFTIMTGMAGVVLGYYFGRVPADARATEAQDAANSAIEEKAKAIADNNARSAIVTRQIRAIDTIVLQQYSEKDLLKGTVTGPGIQELQKIRGELEASVMQNY
jgi:hypothetical protein